MGLGRLCGPVVQGLFHVKIRHEHVHLFLNLIFVNNNNNLITWAKVLGHMENNN